MRLGPAALAARWQLKAVLEGFWHIVATPFMPISRWRSRISVELPSERLTIFQVVHYQIVTDYRIEVEITLLDQLWQLDCDVSTRVPLV